MLHTYALLNIQYTYVWDKIKYILFSAALLLSESPCWINAARGRVFVHTPAPDFLPRLQHHPAKFILTRWWVWLPWLQRKTLIDLTILKMARSGTHPTPDNTRRSIASTSHTAHCSYIPYTCLSPSDCSKNEKYASVKKRKSQKEAGKSLRWKFDPWKYSTRARSLPNSSNYVLLGDWWPVGMSVTETSGCVS